MENQPLHRPHQQIYRKKYFNKIKKATSCVLVGICFGEGRIVAVYEKREMNINRREFVATNSRLLTLTTFPNEDNDNLKTSVATMTKQTSVEDVFFDE